jgi:RNA polymerase sigma-70 factor (ECF subfamily)
MDFPICLHLIANTCMINPDKYRHIDDQQLLQRFYADKNNEWLGILLHRYTMLLLGVCMKYLKNEDEARDGVQQVFLKAITELHKYKVDYFKSWLYMVAKNHCLMKLRDKHKTPADIDNHTYVSAPEPADVAGLQQKDNLLTAMEQAITLLNKEQQQCITLFYLQKKSYQQITDITGYNMMQVKSHIQNGKRNLKIMLQRQQPYEQ